MQCLPLYLNEGSPATGFGSTLIHVCFNLKVECLSCGCGLQPNLDLTRLCLLHPDCC
jgi:hypothetical protein